MLYNTNTNTRQYLDTRLQKNYDNSLGGLYALWIVAFHPFKRENCRWWRQMLKLERSIRRQLRHENPTHLRWKYNTNTIQTHVKDVVVMKEWWKYVRCEYRKQWRLAIGVRSDASQIEFVCLFSFFLKMTRIQLSACSEKLDTNTKSLSLSFSFNRLRRVWSSITSA